MPANKPQKPPFKKRERRVPDKRLYAVADGQFLSLSEVSDPVYSQKLYGDGYALRPSGDLIVSPCQASVAMIPYTKHCIGLENENGDQILVHFGINTSQYKGKGFEFLVSEGAKVKTGTPLVKMDRRFFELQNADLTICVVLTNQKPNTWRLLETDGLQAGKTPVMERK